MSQEQRIIQLSDQYSDQLWRLNNLYYITDKDGKKILFRMNSAQEELYRELWWRTTILKARQFGFSTFLLIYALDTAIFNDYFAAGVIAHTLPDAKKLFETKILFPYERLPDGIRAMRRSSRDRADEIQFNNHSSVTVSTSFRSGTLQWLHVSELGKIASKYPDKAEEIKTGAIEAVGKNGMVVLESTAEGRSGYFYETCMTAKADADSGKQLTQLDYKFFFMPWWRNTDYQLTYDGLGFADHLVRYFDELENHHNIKLTDDQKAWYAIKERSLKDKMFREYPSTPEEAFKAAIEGAYFTQEIADTRKQGRITQVPILPGVTVETWWDIGHDTTSIWLTQTSGMYCHLIGYLQSAGRKLRYYKDQLDAFAEKHDVKSYYHHWPHDMGNEIDWSHEEHKTRYQVATEMGMRGEVHPRMKNKEDGIEAARNFFGYCVFDEKRCDEGIKGLEAYRKKWNDKTGDWLETPLHDWASHPSDAFQQLALYHRFPQEKARHVVQASSTIKKVRWGA